MQLAGREEILYFPVPCDIHSSTDASLPNTRIRGYYERIVFRSSNELRNLYFIVTYRRKVEPTNATLFVG